MERTDAIIILGHRLLPGNLPSDDLKRRIDRAVALWRETNAPIVMPCGGITHERMPEVLAAGAKGACVMSGLMMRDFANFWRA